MIMHKRIILALLLIIFFLSIAYTVSATNYYTHYKDNPPGQNLWIFRGDGVRMCSPTSIVTMEGGISNPININPRFRWYGFWERVPGVFCGDQMPTTALGGIYYKAYLNGVEILNTENGMHNYNFDIISISQPLPSHALIGGNNGYKFQSVGWSLAYQNAASSPMAWNGYPSKYPFFADIWNSQIAPYDWNCFGSSLAEAEDEFMPMGVQVRPYPFSFQLKGMHSGTLKIQAFITLCERVDYSGFGCVAGGWTRKTVLVAEDTISISGKAILQPTIQTRDATDITEDSAVLHGRILEGDSPMDVWFEWGQTTEYGETTSKQVKNKGDTFSFELSGLEEGTTYNFRAVGDNGKVAYGENKEFRTIGIMEVQTLLPSDISEHSAVLDGFLVADGNEPCEVWFEYGETTNYGQTTGSLFNIEAGEYFSIQIHLEPKGYNYRAVAENTQGRVYGVNRQIIGLPKIELLPYSDLTDSSVVLNACLIDDGHGNHACPPYLEHIIDETEHWSGTVGASDIDGDGNMELIAVNLPFEFNISDGRMSWWKIDEHGSWTENIIYVPVHPVGSPSSLAFAPVYESHMDIITAGYHSGIIIWENIDGGNGWERHYLPNRTMGWVSVQASPELIIGTTRGLGYQPYLFQYDFIEGWKKIIPINFGEDRFVSRTAFLADINGNSYTDITMFANIWHHIWHHPYMWIEIGNPAWLENKHGDASEWIWHEVDDDDFTHWSPIYAYDINGNGVTDLISIIRIRDEPQKLVWWQNIYGDGSGWRRHEIDTISDDFTGWFSSPRTYWEYLFVEDINGNGHLDIIVRSGNTLTTYENRGDGRSWIKGEGVFPFPVTLIEDIGLGGADFFAASQGLRRYEILGCECDIYFEIGTDRHNLVRVDASIFHNAFASVSCGQKYIYRAVAKNERFTAYSDFDSFYVNCNPETREATSVGKYSAVLHGYMADEKTTVWFEYMLSSESEATSTREINNHKRTFSTHIDELVPYQEYRFRALASKDGIIRTGLWLTFETVPATPVIRTRPATIRENSAFLSADIIRAGFKDAEAWFEYHPVFPWTETDIDGLTTLIDKTFVELNNVYYCINSDFSVKRWDGTRWVGAEMTFPYVSTSATIESAVVDGETYLFTDDSRAVRWDGEKWVEDTQITSGFNEWNHRKKITIDSSQVASTLYNFPILLNITCSDIRDGAQSSGADILFTLESEWYNPTEHEKLNHEIEFYNSSNGNLIVWVNVTELKHDVDTDIYIYYGNRLAANQENVAGTWDSHYIFVYHCADVSGGLSDSTGKNNAIILASENPTYRVKTPIGHGIELDGETSFSIDGEGTFNEVTMTMYFKNTINAHMREHIWHDKTGVPTAYTYGAPGAALFEPISPPVKAPEVTGGLDPFTGWNMIRDDDYSHGWYLFTHLARDNPDYHALFGNGDFKGSSSAYCEETNIEGIELFGKTGAGGTYFNGIISEVRLSNIIRSDAWIETKYNNLANEFFTIGGEENKPLVSTHSIRMTFFNIGKNSYVALATNFGIEMRRWDGSTWVTDISMLNGIKDGVYSNIVSCTIGDILYIFLLDGTEYWSGYWSGMQWVEDDYISKNLEGYLLYGTAFLSDTYHAICNDGSSIVTFRYTPERIEADYTQARTSGVITGISTQDEGGIVSTRIDNLMPGRIYVFRAAMSADDGQAQVFYYGSTLTFIVQETNGGGGWEPGNGNIIIPPLPPPKYPEGFSIDSMYDLLRITFVPNSDSKVTVMVIDSGLPRGTYTAEDGTVVDFERIQGIHHPNLPNPFDANGHGTFVNYEIAWLLQQKCENAKQISYRVFDEMGGAPPEQFLDALKKAEEIHPDIVSISAGGIGTSDDAFSRQVERLRSKGIIVVVAAGNSGPFPGTVLSPAVSGSAIAVGAFDWMNTFHNWTFIDDEVCEWSSRGPVPGIRPKPDVVAPGESIAGPWLHNHHKEVSGTSLAAPLISAGAAVVVANNRGLVDAVRLLYFFNGAIIPNTFEDALKEACYTYEGWDGGENDWGAGIPLFDDVNQIFRTKLINLLIFYIAAIAIIIIILTFIVMKWKSNKW